MRSERQQRERIIARAAATEAHIRARKKKVIRAIVVLVIAGAIIITIDNVSRDKGSILPIDFKDQPGTVAVWTKSGFLKSIDESGADAVVDEVIWKEMSLGEKNAVTMLLASYCSEKNRTAEYQLTIRGNNSHVVLASVDERGLHIE